MRSEQSSEGVTLTAGCFVLVFAGEYILQEREPASGGGDSGCEDDADSSTTASSSSASTDGANSSAYSSLDKALGLVHFDSTDFAEVKNCSRLVCFLFGCFFLFLLLSPAVPFRWNVWDPLLRPLSQGVLYFRRPY